MIDTKFPTLSDDNRTSLNKLLQQKTQTKGKHKSDFRS